MCGCVCEFVFVCDYANLWEVARMCVCVYISECVSESVCVCVCVCLFGMRRVSG